VCLLPFRQHLVMPFMSVVYFAVILSIFSFSHGQLLSLLPHLLTLLLHLVMSAISIHRCVVLLQSCVAAVPLSALTYSFDFEPAAFSQVTWAIWITDGGQVDLPSDSVSPDTLRHTSS